jgi:peptide/nickel transport system substrate-binding protein
LEAINLLHMSLLQIDFPHQQHAPALAEAFPQVRLVGDSLTELRYRIRLAAAWDNGRPVLAQDVAFSLKIMFCPGLPNEAARARFSFIKEIQIDKANPRQFTLVCRGKSLEYVQETGDFPILPEATLDSTGQLRRFTLVNLQSISPTAPPNAALQAVANRYLAADPGRFPNHLPGCGAYQLVRWEKDRYLSFRRKPHWWADQLRPALPVLQARPVRLNYVIIPDAATATLALRRGDVDVYPQIPAREFARLRASPAAQAALNFYSTPSYDVVTAGFNTRRPALADALTRQALSRCFDAAGLLKATQLGAGQRTVGIISPANRPNYHEQLPLVPFDAAGAARLLHQAGWQRGAGPESGWFRQARHGARQQLRLTMRYRADEALFATVALQFQATATELGIPVVLQPTESGAFTVALRAGDFDMYVRILKGNPFMFNFTPILHSLGLGAGNTTGFNTPASDHLIEEIAAADTEAQRAGLLHQFQALMQREAPIVPLFFLPNRIVASRRLAGLHVGSLKPGYDVFAIEPAPQPSPAP